MFLLKPPSSEQASLRNNSQIGRIGTVRSMNRKASYELVDFKIKMNGRDSSNLNRLSKGMSHLCGPHPLSQTNAWNSRAITSLVQKDNKHFK